MDEEASLWRLHYLMGEFLVDSWFANGLLKHRNASELPLFAKQPRELQQLKAQKRTAFPKLEETDNSFGREVKREWEVFPVWVTDEAIAWSNGLTQKS